MLSKRLKTQHHYSPKRKTIDDLPDEVLTKIFNQIDFKSALVCSLVCKRWLEVSNSNINFMSTVNLRISVKNIDWICRMIRTYRIISIKTVSFDQINLDEKWKRVLAHCETLKLLDCKFQNNKQVAYILNSCKSLKVLKIVNLVVNDDGIDERDDWEESPNNFPIKLELALHHNISTWTILRLFQILRMQLSGLHLDLRRLYPRYRKISEWTDMLAFIHQNYSSVFIELYLDYITEPSWPPLFINQIKQLTDLTIDSNPKKIIFNQICENLIELQKLSIYIDRSPSTMTDSKDLKNLKSLPKLKSLKVNLPSSKNKEVLKLSISELNLERLTISPSNGDSGPCKLEFSVPTPAQQLTSVKELYLESIQVTRNLLQQIFKQMPNLEVLSIISWQNSLRGAVFFWDRPSHPKCLTFKKNSINKLTNLRSLSIDGWWIDDSFLRKMRLPKLENFRIYRNNRSRLGGFVWLIVQHLYMQCPKLKPIQFYTNGKIDVACYIINDEEPESTNSDLSDYSDDTTA
jgi:hypothetical protein